MLFLVSVMILESGCQIIEEDQSTSQDLFGDWKLTSQTGALLDICPDEIVTFHSSMLAHLVCPGSDTIRRNFEIENDILTYTETSISYDIDITENGTKLSLKGRNVSRNLFYDKNIAASRNFNISKLNSNNSSEIKK